MTDPRSFKDIVGSSLAAALGEVGDEDPSAAREPLTVRKLAYYAQVSCCELTDSTGVNHCAHPLPEHRPRPVTRRLYEWWWDTRERLGRRVAGWRWPEEDE